MNNSFFEPYRREFPVTKNYIYLDHAGVAPVSLRVKTAIERFLGESTEGGAFQYPAWAPRIVEARRACARLINADPEEIAFVKSTSHGLSIVAKGLDWKPGDNVIIYEKDFPSNVYPWISLKSRGVNVKVIPARNNRILIKDIESLIDPKTRVLSISSVQFLNGFRIDLKKIGTLCKQEGILFCVDAIQSLGLLPMDVREYQIDFLSADAHKWLLGPEGIGIFYCKKELVEQIDPPLIGWRSIQNEFDFDHRNFLLKNTALRFEEGSMNLLGIFGLHAALELLFEIGIDRIGQRVLDLGDVIVGEAEKRGYAVLTPKTREARGGNVTVAGNFDAAKTRDGLGEKGIMVNVRGGGLRISPHFYNTEEEIITTFKMLDLLAHGK